MEHMTFKALLWSADALSVSLPRASRLGSLFRSSVAAHARGRGVEAVFTSKSVPAQAGASGDVLTSGAAGISSRIGGRRVGRHFRRPSGLLLRDGGQGAASRASFNTATAALRLSISAVILHLVHVRGVQDQNWLYVYYCTPVIKLFSWGIACEMFPYISRGNTETSHASRAF